MSPRSVNTIARTLIQTVVRQKLNAIKSDPERSLRNLVDMGLSFAAGSEQKRFLQQAQRTLQDENSAYYRIIYDMALHVDTEHLMGFGMNLGYNSLTAGARTIRRLESECGYDIPWCLTLAIDRKGYTAHESDYTNLIEQGKRLGIYTYLIIAPELPVGLFTLLRQQKDCAFLHFTSPDELTGDVIDTMAQLYHVMPVVRFGDGAEEICDAMRRREMLYSVFLPYHSEESENISSDGDVLDIEQFHAPLTIFMSYTAPEKGQSSPFYRRIIAARYDLHTQTIPVELWEDLRYVDGALSPRASYSVVFDERCRLIRPDGTVDDSISFSAAPLESILASLQ